jgi:hypothetical protein
MAGHRNRLENNLIENNGRNQEVAGIRVRGETRDVVLKNNTLRDTRSAELLRQTTGIRLEPRVGSATLEGNAIESKIPVEDQRREEGKNATSISKP